MELFLNNVTIVYCIENADSSNVRDSALSMMVLNIQNIY